MANRAVLNYNGAQFETEIAILLRRYFPDAIIMHDIWVFSYELDKYTQIDLLMITDTGLYFIEAKNWKDWVCGNYNDKLWKGKGRSMNVMSVFNIVHQNMIHIRALRNAIRHVDRWNKPEYRITEENGNIALGHNIIVFPDSTNLMTDAKEVINIGNLVSRVQILEELSDDHINKSKYAHRIKEISDSARNRYKKGRSE